MEAALELIACGADIDYRNEEEYNVTSLHVLAKV